MIEITTHYEGGLHCTSTHGPSGSTVSTDAPVDNNGRGETFSPTDLIATALVSCMATIMGIVGQRKKIPLEGLKLKVEKHMSSDQPRRISKLAVVIDVPLPSNHPDRKMLEGSALSCPVFQSINPEIEVPIDWNWENPS
ncbi:redox protein [Oceaniferula spumae]|uniref:Redox protein n=1 Tax=Oceaniferula spumae TaxID=2979115 RepID=A0AAT9FI78_9BACT